MNKPQGEKIGLLTLAGMCIGLLFGAIFDQVSLFLGIGTAVGLLAGAVIIKIH